MPWIKAKNGNVLEVPDVDLAAKLVKEGHAAFESDPRERGAKAWDPNAEPAAGVPIEVNAAGDGQDVPDGVPSDGWTVVQLKAYAKTHGLDLDGARTKGDVLAAILTAGEDDDPDDEDEDDELADEADDESEDEDDAGHAGDDE